MQKASKKTCRKSLEIYNRATRINKYIQQGCRIQGQYVNIKFMSLYWQQRTGKCKMVNISFKKFVSQNMEALTPASNGRA